MLRSGVSLSNRYLLTERIATGGMGDVWRAEDVVLGRQVAVKVLLPALLSDPDFLTRFRAEARMMAALRHPGIVQVYDSGEDTLDDGSRADYLVMEFVDGQPLSQRLAEQGQLSVGETMSVIAHAAQALHAAHGAGIVHRDVKPSNLMIQADGSVVLVDFGVARSTSVTSITSTNAVPGTALYMAPEQASGRPVSPATDIYALGAVAYHCLTGGPPFTAENALQVAVRHLHDELPPLPEELPESVHTLVGRALAKDPEQRFPDAEAMADAARKIRNDPTAALVIAAAVPGTTGGGNPSTLADQPVIHDGADGERRRSRLALAGAAAAVLLVGAGLAAVLAFGPVQDAPANVDPTPTPSSATPTVTQEERDPDTPDRTGPDRPNRSTPTATPSSTASPQPAEPTTKPTEPPATPEPSNPGQTPPASEEPEPTPSPNASQPAGANAVVTSPLG